MVKKLNENKINPFLDTTLTTYYDDTMSNKKYKNDATIKDYYKFEKGVYSDIVYMTAKEYMDMVSKYVFNGNDAYRAVDDKKVNTYAQKIKKGMKFPLPYIDFKMGGQEGRHRMLACAKVYGEDTRFPVLQTHETNASEKEIEEYAKKAYPNDVEWGIEYVKCQLGMYDEWEEKDTINYDYEIDDLDNLSWDDFDPDDLILYDDE